jgi:hypothetical protein
MDGGLAKIYSKANTRVQLGNLASCCLQGVFKDVYWGTKGVSIFDVQGTFDVGKLLGTRGSIFLG